MKAHAIVVAERRGGHTRCTTLRSAPPLTLRATTADGVHLVGSAAGPVGGDELSLEVTVAAGATLTLRSVAAQLVLPAPTPAASAFNVAIDIGAAASLRWLTEPTVLVRGADHRVTTTIALAPGAELVWRDEVVLGRDAEACGSLLHRVRVICEGRALLCTEVALGPAWPTSSGPAGVADARVVATLLLVGEPARRAQEHLGGDSLTAAEGGGRWAAFRLADDALIVTALGTELHTVRASLSPGLTCAG